MKNMPIGHHGITGPGARLGALAALALGLLLLPAGAAAEEFTVNRNADTDDGTCDAADCTLREAIAAANVNNEPDTITFDPPDNDRVILLSGTELEIADDTAGPDLTIDGDLDGTPDITVDANSSSRVFFIRPGAEATLEGLVITGGNSGGGGGGIVNFDGTLTVANSTISGNSAANRGGGIFNAGTLTVANSTISNSTISGNSANFNSGGIDNGGTLTVANSTISGNSGTGSFGGGGIRNSGTLEIKSTIVAGNTAGADCANFATLTSLGFNLDSDGTCEFTETSDQQNVVVADVLVTDGSGDPLLADNGGPTETIALVDLDTNSDNPAVDAIPVDDCTDVDDMLVETDQRGVDRPQPSPTATATSARSSWSRRRRSPSPT